MGVLVPVVDGHWHVDESKQKLKSSKIYIYTFICIYNISPATGAALCRQRCLDFYNINIIRTYMI